MTTHAASATPIAAPSVTVRPSVVLGAIVAPKTWRATIHVMLDFWVGLVAFVFMVTGISLVFGLLVTIVFAIPPLVITLLGTRAIGVIERARYDAVLDVHIANPHLPFEGTVFDRIKRRLASAATGRSSPTRSSSSRWRSSGSPSC